MLKTLTKFTPPNMATGSRLPDTLPASLEVVRRKAMVAVHIMERETEVFLDRCTVPLDHYDNWLHFAHSVCENCEKNLSDVRDFKQFDMLLTRLKDNTEIKSQAEYKELRKVCERGRLFDYIAFRLRSNIAGAHENLLKYCLSFEPDFRQYDLDVVKEFENGIVEWNTQIANSLSQVDRLLDDVDLYKTPMTAYLAQVDTVTYYMVEVCRTLQQTAEPMKRWVVADSAYARKAQTAINSYNRRKLELRDLVHQVEFKRDQLGLKLKRRTFFAAKLHAELAKVREDRRLYQCRKQTLDENRLKAEAEMQRKEVDLDDVTRKLLTRTSNSPTVFDQLTAVIESLRCDIWSLEAKLETMDTQARSLNRDQHTLQKYIDCLNGELDGSFKCFKAYGIKEYEILQFCNAAHSKS
ncbi:hypothetical protein LSAT2_010830 [Lamellibrachia satsuma]|nr:hypothetical protein LSAT2_010830 [Lamellibrachia satsuma]